MSNRGEREMVRRTATDNKEESCMASNHRDR